MPLNLSQELLQPLVQREIAKEDMQRRFAPEVEQSPPETKPLPVWLASVMGAGMDAASTYKFLHNGNGQEDNPTWRGLSPAASSFGVVVNGPLTYLLLKQKWPKLADMFGAQFGATQFGTGAENFYNSGQFLDTNANDRYSQKVRPK